MNEEDFVKAVDDADFEILIEGKDNLYEFLRFVKDSIDGGDNDVVIRCVCETEDEGSIEPGLPFYVWLVYHVNVEGDFVGLSFQQFFLPRDDNMESYYITPRPVEGRNFFSITVK